MQRPPKIRVPRYDYNTMADRIKSKTMLRWLIAPFTRYYGGHLLPSEQMLIGCLELQRKLTGRVRAYILDPMRRDERLLVNYTNYIETTWVTTPSRSPSSARPRKRPSYPPASRPGTSASSPAGDPTKSAATE